MTDTVFMGQIIRINRNIDDCLARNVKNKEKNAKRMHAIALWRYLIAYTDMHTVNSKQL